MKEHFRHIRLFQIDKSAVAAHFWDEGHGINEEAELLRFIDKNFEFNVWEKLYIQKYRDRVMNFEVGYRMRLR